MPAPAPATIQSAIYAKSTYKTPGVAALAADLGTAIASVWGEFTNGISVAPMPVVGGLAAPAGPLAGGIVTLSPGLLQSAVSWKKLSAVFVSSFTGVGALHNQQLVTAFSDVLDQTFPIWVAGYSASLIATGGSAGWIPPAGATPPAPGPWVGGVLTPQPLAAGVSVGDGQFNPQSLLMLTIPALHMDLKYGGVATPGMQSIIKAFWEAFVDLWKAWKASTLITGGSGSGTANPPNGMISVGSHIGARLQ